MECSDAIYEEVFKSTATMGKAIHAGFDLLPDSLAYANRIGIADACNILTTSYARWSIAAESLCCKENKAGQANPATMGPGSFLKNDRFRPIPGRGLAPI